MWLYSSNIEFLKSFRVLDSWNTIPLNYKQSQKEKDMENYNTDSMKPLTKGQDELNPILSADKKIDVLQLSESEKEKIRRRRWLESISDCV